MAAAGAFALAFALGGCAVSPEQAAAMAANEEQAKRELAAGIELYDKGDYVLALRSLLMAQGVWQASLDVQVTAHKYVAFSHCLLNRPTPCKQSFGDLLRLKPDYELAAAEAGHPQWSAAFKQAKQEAAARPAPQAMAPVSR